MITKTKIKHNTIADYYNELKSLDYVACNNIETIDPDAADELMIYRNGMPLRTPSQFFLLQCPNRAWEFQKLTGGQVVYSRVMDLMIVGIYHDDYLHLHSGIKLG